MILSAVMMLDHINETAIADKIRHAIGEVVKEGKVRTYDMMQMPGSQDVINNGAATTGQMTDAVIAKL